MTALASVRDFRFLVGEYDGWVSAMAKDPC